MTGNIKKFYAALATDSALKSKLEAQSGEKKLTREAFVAFANEAGFEFTLEQLKEYESALTEDDLEKVAGGGTPWGPCDTTWWPR